MISGGSKSIHVTAKFVNKEKYKHNEKFYISFMLQDLRLCT